MPSSDIAKKLGVSRSLVERKKRELREEGITIKNFSSGRKNRDDLGKGRQWSEEQIALLGTMSDIEVSERLGISRVTVFNKRDELGIPAGGMRGPKTREWTEEQIALLGTMVDREVAERLGIKHALVLKKRTDLGIPIYDKSRKWTEEQIGLLGTMSSSEIAKKLGISKASVDRKKKKLIEEGLTIKNFPTGRKKRS